MNSDELKWRERYYELEKALEQMISGFEFVMQQSSTQSVNMPQVDSTSVEYRDGKQLITCEASCAETLEYCFDFIYGENLLITTGFIAQNSMLVPDLAERCLVTVRRKNNVLGSFHEHENLIVTEVDIP